MDSKTQILLISEAEKKHFINYYQTLLHRFHLLPPGIDRNYFSLSQMNQIGRRTRRESNITDQQFLIFFIASNYKLKGLDRIFLSIASLPHDLRKKTSLWIIGQGNISRYRLKAKILKVDQNIKFLGARDDVPSLLFAADLLLHPAYHEAGGLVLLEALAAGVPVLTTDVCGFALHINRAEAGIVLPSPFKQETLNETLKQVLDFEILKQWKENALAYSKNQDLYSRTERVVDIIENTALEKTKDKIS